MVKEHRVYSFWKEGSDGTVTGDTGIMAAKEKLNQLHQELADQGFSQVNIYLGCYSKNVYQLGPLTILLA